MIGLQIVEKEGETDVSRTPRLGPAMPEAQDARDRFSLRHNFGGGHGDCAVGGVRPYPTGLYLQYSTSRDGPPGVLRRDQPPVQRRRQLAGDTLQRLRLLRPVGVAR